MANTKRIPLEERLRARVDMRGDDECWEWQGSISTQGYGRIAAGGSAETSGSPLYTHRVMYELRVGPIPGGLEIDHLCRNRRCCNPAHLEAVTRRENVMRGDAPALLRARNRAKVAA